MNAEKLAKLQASVRIGGKGTPRRKRKAVRAATGGDDKKVQAALKKLGVQAISGIEEVNFFLRDSKVIHIAKPKVQASVPSNTFAISGAAETKELAELLPQILHQLGRDSLNRIAQQFTQLGNAPGAAADDDDDVPDLVENTNFEEASKQDEGQVSEQAEKSKE